MLLAILAILALTSAMVVAQEWTGTRIRVARERARARMRGQAVLLQSNA
jgi:hypothetical protein